MGASLYSLNCAAASHGNVHLLKELKQKYPAHSKNYHDSWGGWIAGIYSNAASSGHVAVLEWVSKVYPTVRLDQSHYNAAAKNGHLTVLEYFLAQEKFLLSSAHFVILYTIQCGYLEILHQIKDRLAVGAGRRAEALDHKVWLEGHAFISAAAAEGNIEILQFLRAINPPCGFSCHAAVQAIENGHFHALQWLMRQEPPCPVDIMALDAACFNGRSDMVEWLIVCGFITDWNENTFVAAAASDSGNSVHILKLLYHKWRQNHPSYNQSIFL